MLKEIKNKKKPCSLPNIFVKYNTNITYDIKNIRNENSKINILFKIMEMGCLKKLMEY